ncbi:hypothetical protein [Robiginitalea biformata]|uniref:Uncharacterized protein n=1 Tax=Robiginitalea biformata (strain ATCC BAA-864 / DSM 15991 / KCTC 12146 / HTCC2501) TaxID=313596 RepID=A4CPW8_ROBBH|nr:hypothetical protein [Robiginitalea biformata]EAR14053.1 hypothetical protein RB2501_01465 [Robiginitalea biformata HTCC2501]
MNKVANLQESPTLPASQFCEAVLKLRRTTALDLDIGLDYISRNLEMGLRLTEDGEYIFDISARVRGKWFEPTLTDAQKQILREKLNREAELVEALLKAEELEEWEEPYHPYTNAPNYIP